MISIKVLTPADAPFYRSIRLEALRLYPEQFGSGYKRSSNWPNNSLFLYSPSC